MTQSNRTTGLSFIEHTLDPTHKGFMGSYTKSWKKINVTVKPVCNDHLSDKIYYLWFIEDWRYQFTLANNFCLLELI